MGSGVFFVAAIEALFAQKVLPPPRKRLPTPLHHPSGTTGTSVSSDKTSRFVRVTRSSPKTPRTAALDPND